MPLASAAALLLVGYLGGDGAGCYQVPFAALKYAIGECNYGGRVTDDKDRRLLNTLLDMVYCPAILGAKFRLSESGMYYVPDEGETQEHYIGYINSLPIVALPEVCGGTDCPEKVGASLSRGFSPQVFGLHENADIAKDQQSTQVLLDTLLLTRGSGGGGGGAGNEELVDGLVKDILKRMPANFDIEKAQLKYPVMYEESMNQARNALVRAPPGRDASSPCSARLARL